MTLFKAREDAALSLSIPHPEEPQNIGATIGTVDIKQMVGKWLKDWGVPEIYYTFWLTKVEIKVMPECPYPAETLGQVISVKPEWTNPGVVAHEASHVSFSQLTITDKAQFEVAFDEVLKTDPLLKYLYSIKPNMSTNIIEAHADAYRYLGSQMPTILKPYYPKLF